MSERGTSIAFAIIGLIMVVLAVGVGLRDANQAASEWNEMGPLAPGKEIPNFHASILSGGELDNEALNGEVTLLNFWATWCGVCEQQMPNIAALHREYGTQGLRVVGVNTDRAGNQDELVAGYVASRELDFEMALDSGTMGKAFRVSLIPHVALVDRRGELRFVHQGRVGKDTLAEEIEELLSE